MGNCKSCFDVDPQTATLIDAHGRLREIKVPITAAEIMLDETGHIVSPQLHIRQTRRITAMKADEGLVPGNIYLLVPASRNNSYVSEPEMALVDYACEKRLPKRRRCKVLPTATGGLPALALGNGTTGNRVGNACTWRPALEPIFEDS